MDDIPFNRLLGSITGPYVTKAVIRDSVSALRATPLSGICVEPLNIEICHQILGDSAIPIIGLVNYPLGLAAKSAAVRLGQWCYEQKADEILCGLPYGLLHSDASREIERMFSELLSLRVQRGPRVYLPTIELSTEDTLEISKMVSKFEIPNVHIGKSSNIKTQHEAISDFKSKMPMETVITVETSGGMREANELLSAGADYVCLQTFGETLEPFDNHKDQKARHD